MHTLCEADSEPPGRVSVIHQINTDSDPVRVLGLRPLIESLRVHQGQPPPSCSLQTFARGQGVRIRPVEFILLKQIKICHRKGHTS